MGFSSENASFLCGSQTQTKLCEARKARPEASQKIAGISRPVGTWLFFARCPAVKTAGYSRKSLRDNLPPRRTDQAYYRDQPGWRDDAGCSGQALTSSSRRMIFRILGRWGRRLLRIRIRSVRNLRLVKRGSFFGLWRCREWCVEGRLAGARRLARTLAFPA
jgi:hypothetical protein